MKNFKQLMAVAVIAASSMPMMAQFSNVSGSTNSSTAEFASSYSRFTVGYNAIYTSGKGARYLGADKDPISLNGFALKYVKGFGISKQYPLYIETGLRANMGFYSYTYDENETHNAHFKIDYDNRDDYDFEDDKIAITTMSLAIPVNLAYRIPVGSTAILQPYTGINLKANILAKYKEYGKSVNLFDKKDVDGKKNTWNRFQMGWQIGLGLNLNKFYLGLEYGLDFMELAKKLNTSHFEVAVGVNF